MASSWLTGCSSDPDCETSAECISGAVCENGTCESLDDASTDPLLEVSNDVVEDVQQDSTQDTPSCNGEFGCACTEATDCESGFCVAGPDGDVCTVACRGACPDESWTCRLVSDSAQLCLPPNEVLCQPCEASVTCAGEGNFCVALDDGNACGIACGDANPCPFGYDCEDVMTSDLSTVVTQCIPDDGYCTGCVDADNDQHGLGAHCQGRDCDDEISTVHFDASEICDGLDNNCDNVVDESFLLNSDPSNCGTCGTICSSPSAEIRCTAGACVESACPTSQDDCDGDSANGCETDSATDPMNCGFCGRTCAEGVACVAGECVVEVCSDGTANCDANPSNGCETATFSNPMHCGGCDVICADGTACERGTCVESDCSSGLGDCNSDDGDGCETNTNEDPNNCGACGNACDIVNGDAVCTDGSCGVEGCAPGFLDCDENPNNGCEADTRTSVGNCGGCGAICAIANGAPRCSAGDCELVQCTGAFADCDDNIANGCETNTAASPGNCGGCGNTCSLGHAASFCSAGQCALGACEDGWEDCDGDPNNGCETNVTTTSNCGSCGAICDATNAIADCSTGTCQIGACDAGFGDCDGNVLTGCETDIIANNDHCGACGTPCTLPNAAANCRDYTCHEDACFSGWYECDFDFTNGCESNQPC